MSTVPPSALFEAFVRRGGAGWQADLDPARRGELERALAEAVAGAQGEWPGIRLDPERFVGFLAERCATPAELAGLRAADLYIACACLAEVDGAVAGFRDRFWPKIAGILRVRGASADQVAEAEQRVWEMLFVGKDGAPPVVATYAGRGDLRAWLRSIATRTANRIQFPAGAGADAGDDQLHELPAADDPELDALKARYRGEFAAAFREALAELTPRQRNLLRQHFIDGLTIDQLGAVYRVHRASAARWLAAARAQLFDGTKDRLSAAVGAADSTVESIIRLVHSQLDFSLHELLA